VDRSDSWLSAVAGPLNVDCEEIGNSGSLVSRSTPRHSLKLLNFSSGTSKFESDLPGSADSNFDVMQADGSVRDSQFGRQGDCGQQTSQP
jgi:hypothetical protein